jgi:hypothetical protein
MSVYRRGKVWWYKFKFAGQEIRESSKSDSKTIAKDAERARRRELETSFNRIPVRERVPLFKAASQQWISQKCGLSRKSIAGYEQRLEHVNAYFGQTPSRASFSWLSNCCRLSSQLMPPPTTAS